MLKKSASERRLLFGLVSFVWFDTDEINQINKTNQVFTVPQ